MKTLWCLLLATACSGEAEVFEKSNAELAARVGDACASEAENHADFAGFSTTEVDAEEQPACGAGVCLTYHFQGRTTCPSGNDPAAPTCTTPDGQPVTVPVLPQMGGQVLCSCRCDGPSTGGPYCGCPAGFVCQPNVFEDVQSAYGRDRYAGGYCLRAP